MKYKERFIKPQYTICPICNKGYLIVKHKSCVECGFKTCLKCDYIKNYNNSLFDIKHYSSICDKCFEMLANYSTD